MVGKGGQPKTATPANRERLEEVKVQLLELGIRDAPKSLAAAEKLLDGLTKGAAPKPSEPTETKKKGTDRAMDLPLEVWNEVVGYLSLRSLLHLGLASQWFMFVAESAPTVKSVLDNTAITVKLEHYIRRDDRQKHHLEERVKVTFRQADSHHPPAELKYPWTPFHSARHAIVEAQIVLWARILAVPPWSFGPLPFQEQAHRELWKDHCPNKRDIVQQKYDDTMSLFRHIVAAAWLRAVREIDEMVGFEEGGEKHPLLIFARAKCNAAAGMGNTAVELSEQLPEKPWEHPLVDKAYAAMFGFPSDEKSLQAFLSEMRQASLDSIVATEEDVTLAPQMRLKKRDIVNSRMFQADYARRHGIVQ